MASEGLGFRQSGQDTVKHRDPAHTTEELKITATQGNSTFPQVKGLEPSKDDVDLRERGAAGAVDAMIHPLVRPLAEHTSIVRACALLGPFKGRGTTGHCVRPSRSVNARRGPRRATP
jgi:hypothetical protein